MDNVVLAEILKAHEDRTARLHAMVLDARDAILTAIKSQDDPPVWMREAFDKLHAVHHGMGGDPFQMHMRAAVEVACERLREAIADFMVEHVAIPGKSSYGLADEILAAAFAPSERRPERVEAAIAEWRDEFGTNKLRKRKAHPSSGSRG